MFLAPLAGCLLFICSVSIVQSAESKGKFLGATTTEYPDWFKQSFLEFEDDIAEATAHGKRLMLFFHQDGCPYCNLLVERNLAQKNIETLARENLDIVAINIWGDRDVVNVGGKEFSEKTLAQALGVQYTPTLLFFNESKQTILRLDGYYPPDEFKIALDYIIGKHDETQSYDTYFRTHREAPPSGALNHESFFLPSPLNLFNSDSKEKKPLAVYFEQTQCPNCDSLHQTILADPETRKLIDQFDNVQLDMWADTSVVTPTNVQTTAKDWATDLKITYAPSIVFFDPNGVEVMRTDAYLKKFHIQSVFDYVAGKAYLQEPSFQRYLSARAEQLVDQGLDVNIWE